MVHSVNNWRQGSLAVRILFWTLLAVVLLFPIAAGILPGITLEALGGILKNDRQWRLLGNSLLIAFGGGAGALLLGAPAGYLLARGRLPLQKTLTTLLALPLLIPNYVAAIAWVELLGPQGLFTRTFGLDSGLFPLYTPGGVALVYALTHFPIPALSVGAAVKALDGRLEDAARLDCTAGAVFTKITLPLLFPAAIAGATLVGLIAFLGFTIPSLLQVQSYPVEIYTEFSSFYDFAAAGAQCLPLLVIGLTGAWIVRKSMRRHTVGLSPNPENVSFSSNYRYSAFIYCGLLACVTTALPFWVLIADAWPPASLWTVWQSAWQELATSLGLATGTATLTLGAAILLHRACVPGTGLLSALPFLVSGPVLGIGLIRLWNHAGPAGWIYDSFAILLLACCARYFIFAWIATRTALNCIDPMLEEAAANCGAKGLRRLFSVTLPLALPGLFAAWAFVFVLTLGDLDAVVLVTPPGWTPLSVRLFSLMHYGPGPLVAALSLLAAGCALFATAIFAALAAWLTRTYAPRK